MASGKRVRLVADTSRQQLAVELTLQPSHDDKPVRWLLKQYRKKHVAKYGAASVFAEAAPATSLPEDAFCRELKHETTLVVRCVESAPARRAAPSPANASAARAKATKQTEPAAPPAKQAPTAMPAVSTNVAPQAPPRTPAISTEAAPRAPPLSTEAAPRAPPPRSPVESGAIAANERAGVQGALVFSCASMLEALAREGSTPDEVASPELMRRVWEFEHQVHELHVRPLLEDEGMRYGRDMAAAVRALVGSFPARPRVLVVGLGTGVAAVAAARAGADVVWLEAVARHCAVAEELAAKNGVDVAVERHVGERASEWAGGAFDAVVVEPVGDWLADGRLAECALAARRWLKPGGRFLPRAATVSVVLASVRTGTVSGFDMDAFDDFRSNAMLCYGPSDVRHDVLSAPATLRVDFEAVARGRGGAGWQTRAELAVSEESAVFNASVFWATVDLVDGVAPRAFAPRLDLNGPRARCEGLSYVGAERAVRRGDRVPADLRYDGYKFSVKVQCTDEPLKTYRGEPVLGYHFPMLNDDTRNAAFETLLNVDINFILAPWRSSGRR